MHTEESIITELLAASDLEEREELWGALLTYPAVSSMINNLCRYASRKFIEDAESLIYEALVIALASENPPSRVSDMAPVLTNMLKRSKGSASLINIPEAQYGRFIRVMKHLDSDESNLDALLKKCSMSWVEFDQIRRACGEMESLSISQIAAPSVLQAEAEEVEQILEIAGEVLSEDQGAVIEEKFFGSPYRNRSDSEVAETLNEDQEEERWTRRIVQKRKSEALDLIRREIGFVGEVSA